MSTNKFDNSASCSFHFNWPVDMQKLSKGSKKLLKSNLRLCSSYSVVMPAL